MTELNIEEQQTMKFDEIWKAAQTNHELIMKHPYIIRKQIQPHGIRINNENKLIVPLYDINGNIQGLQEISPAEKKRFTKGTSKKACFYPIGELEGANTVLICEGFATGASLYAASNIPTVIAFDAGNLEPVTGVIKQTYNNSGIVICGDDDWYKETNVGNNKAKEAAEKYNCYAVFPEFNAESKKQKVSDFNDLHVLEGLKSVQEQINYALSESEVFYANQPKYQLPEQFCVNEKGVFYLEPEKDPLLLCSKIEVTGWCADKEDGNHGLILEWKSRHSEKHHKWAMPKRLLAGDGNAIKEKLLDEGVYICPTRRAKEKLLEYLQRVEPIKKNISVSSVGWHDNHFILPGVTIPTESDFVLQSENHSNFTGFKVSGMLIEWQNNVAKYAYGNSRLIFALSTSFAAPLLKFAEKESCIFHFVGASSTGKSTTLRIAASAWGGGDNPGYIKQWRSTDNAQEATAAAHCDCLLPLDELGQACGKTVGDTVYMLANNQGKNRMNSSAILKKTFEWRVFVLSTGEVTLEDKLHEAGKKIYAGMETRFISIPVSEDESFGIFDDLHEFTSGHEFAGYINDNCEKYYGTAIREYLSKLVISADKDKQSLVSQIHTIQDKFQSSVLKGDKVSGQVKRVAKRFSLVAAAGELAIKLDILPFPKNTAFEACRKCFKSWFDSRGNTEDLETAKAIESLRNYLDQSGSSQFSELTSNNTDQSRTIERAGFREIIDNEYHYYMFINIFKKRCQKWGVNKKAFAKVLYNKGYLQKNDQGDNPSKRFPGEIKRRIYHIKPTIFEEE
jgi:putative DNA primase/helicase